MVHNTVNVLRPLSFMLHELHPSTFRKTLPLVRSVSAHSRGGCAHLLDSGSDGSYPQPHPLPRFS